MGRAYFLQIILSWLYFLARICRDGSMMPPRRRITKWRVESVQQKALVRYKVSLLHEQMSTEEHLQKRVCNNYLSPQSIVKVSARRPAACQRRLAVAPPQAPLRGKHGAVSEGML